MARQLQGQVAGGPVKANLSAETVGELASQLGAEGYTATVNGEPAESGDMLEDRDFVAFSKPVKAG